jgi:hypothetical protein
MDVNIIFTGILYLFIETKLCKYNTNDENKTCMLIPPPAKTAKRALSSTTVRRMLGNLSNLVVPWLCAQREMCLARVEKRLLRPMMLWWIFSVDSEAVFETIFHGSSFCGIEMIDHE